MAGSSIWMMAMPAASRSHTSSRIAQAIWSAVAARRWSSRTKLQCRMVMELGVGAEPGREVVVVGVKPLRHLQRGLACGGVLGGAADAAALVVFSVG